MAVPVAIVCTLLRYALSVATRKSPSQQASSATHMSKSARDAIIEECWLLFSSASLLALSTWATVSHNNGCMLLAPTASCFEGWPLQTHSSEITMTLAVFLGWYMHCLLKNLIPAVGGQHAGAAFSSSVSVKYKFALVAMITLVVVLVQHACTENVAITGQACIVLIAYIVITTAATLRAPKMWCPLLQGCSALK